MNVLLSFIAFVRRIDKVISTVVPLPAFTGVELACGVVAFSVVVVFTMVSSSTLLASESKDLVATTSTCSAASNLLAVFEEIGPHTTPLHVAAFSGHVNDISRLVASGIDPSQVDARSRSALHIAALNDNVDGVKMLIKFGVPVCSSRDITGATPLHAAAERGHLATVLSLLAFDCLQSRGNHTGSTALHVASAGDHVVVINALVKAGQTVVSVDDDRFTPLHVASRAGNVASIMKLLEHGANTFATDKDGRTPLHLAVLNLDELSIGALLNGGADVSMRDNDGDTPLHLAATLRSTSTRVINLLLNAGADVNSPDRSGFTPLHLATLHNDILAMSVLIKHGADTLTPSVTGYTPLHIAAEHGHVSAAEHLLAGGDGPKLLSARDKSGSAPLHAAAKQNHVHVIEAILNNSCLHGLVTSVIENKRPDGATPLHVAAGYGHIESIKTLVAAGANTSSRNNVGDTPLHTASLRGQDCVIKELVALRADVSSRNEQGATAIHVASSSGQLEAVTALIESKADLSGQTGEHVTPLHLAAAKGDDEIVKRLLAAGAPTSIHSTASLITPLHVAVSNNHVEVVMSLINHGANVSSRDANGLTPLHTAANMSMTAITQRLIQAGANISACANDGKTPLELAKQHHVDLKQFTSIEVSPPEVHAAPPAVEVPKTESHGFSIAVKISFNVMLFTVVLQMILVYNRKAIVVSKHRSLAVSVGLQADIARVTSNLQLEETDIRHSMFAAGRSFSAQLETLMIFRCFNFKKRKSPTNDALVVDTHGLSTIGQLVPLGADGKQRTPLHLAIEDGDEFSVSALLSLGADLSSLDERHFTPFHTAAERGDLRVFCQLLRYNEKAAVERVLGLSPLDVAVGHGHVDLVMLILEMGLITDEFFSNTNFAPTITIAVMRNETAILELLLEFFPSSVHTTNSDNWTPLELAVHYNKEECLKIIEKALLREKQVSHCQSSSERWMVALHRMHLRIHQYFQSRSVTGWCAVHMAVAMNRPDPMIERIKQIEEETSPDVLLEWVSNARCSEELSHLLRRPAQVQVLGEGGFGVVYGVVVDGGRRLALKSMRMTNNRNARIAAALETHSSRPLRHKHIVAVAGYHSEVPAHDQPAVEVPAWMVMEWMNGGNLFDWINQHHLEGRVSFIDKEPMLRMLMKQSLEALAYLHEPIHTDPFGRQHMSVVHHDIKPQNMLIHVENNMPVLKLSDFGLARYDRHHSFSNYSSVGGTRGYLPPEANGKRPLPEAEGSPKVQYTPASDMYSWGLSFLRVLRAVTDPENQEPCPHRARDLLVNDETWSDDMKEVILHCLDQENPEERPTAKELLNHRFFAERAHRISGNCDGDDTSETEEQVVDNVGCGFSSTTGSWFYGESSNLNTT